MTNALIRLFIGKNADASDEKVRKKYALLASGTGIVVNFILFAVKLCLGLWIASVALIADGFNNVSDAGSAVLTLIGFHLASKPVDKEHPLGHGRMEYITGFIVDLLILLVGFDLLQRSFDKILHPSLPEANLLTFILLGVAVLVKLWLFFFYRKIAKRISSPALKGAAADSISDCFATSLVLISALVSKLFSVSIDGYAGIGISLFIIFTGVKEAKGTIDLLLGTPPSPQFIEEIYSYALAFPEVVGVHDVLVHDYGPGRQFVSFHAEIPADSDITKAHDVIDQIEREMEEKFHAIVTIHMDPIETNDERVTKMRAFAVKVVQSVDEAFTLHDFRMTYGGIHTNLIFDLLIPTDSKWSKDEASKTVAKKINELRPDCYAVIKAEHPFV